MYRNYLIILYFSLLLSGCAAVSDRQVVEDAPRVEKKGEQPQSKPQLKDTIAPVSDQTLSKAKTSPAKPTKKETPERSGKMTRAENKQIQLLKKIASVKKEKRTKKAEAEKVADKKTIDKKIIEKELPQKNLSEKMAKKRIGKKRDERLAESTSEGVADKAVGKNLLHNKKPLQEKAQPENSVKAAVNQKTDEVTADKNNQIKGLGLESKIGSKDKREEESESQASTAEIAKVDKLTEQEYYSEDDAETSTAALIAEQELGAETQGVAPTLPKEIYIVEKVVEPEALLVDEAEFSLKKGKEEASEDEEKVSKPAVLESEKIQAVSENNNKNDLAKVPVENESLSVTDIAESVVSNDLSSISNDDDKEAVTASNETSLETVLAGGDFEVGGLDDSGLEDGSVENGDLENADFEKDGIKENDLRKNRLKESEVDEGALQKSADIKSESENIGQKETQSETRSETFVLIKQGDSVEKIPAKKISVQSLMSTLNAVLALDWGMITPGSSQRNDQRFAYCYRILGEMRKQNYMAYSPYNVSADDYNRWQQKLGEISLVQLLGQSLNFYQLINNDGNTVNVVETVFETDAKLSEMLVGVQRSNYYFSGVLSFGENSQQSLGGVGRFHGKRELNRFSWFLIKWKNYFYALRLHKQAGRYDLMEIIPLLDQQQKYQRNCRWKN